MEYPAEQEIDQFIDEYLKVQLQSEEPDESIVDRIERHHEMVMMGG